ncbi:hypothetical protein [Lactococcus fujiensis]|uniref:hypothetical protein n=1 Tax=Lactococcus fujiensis TaxID=610251 RepID=UPI0006D08694|nr:hypothetical protein [Lactococcus fujiensis]
MAELDISRTGEYFRKQIENKASEFVYNQLKLSANRASSRKRRFRGRNGKYIVTRNIRTRGNFRITLKKYKTTNGTTIDAGTRSNYSEGYHGMYFLNEKKGIKEVDEILNALPKFIENINL